MSGNEKTTKVLSNEPDCTVCGGKPDEACDIDVHREALRATGFGGPDWADTVFPRD